MISDRDNQFEPICRFGPGGDFVSDLPQSQPQPNLPSHNPLGKVLETIGEIMNAVLGAEFQADEKNFLDAKGNFKYEVKISDTENPPYPATARIIKSDSLLSGQQMLFPDNRRISIKSVHKQKHRIRTHHRTAKKRPSLSIAGQGSLFDDNFKSARTA